MSHVPPPQKVFLLTLGCQKNVSDTENLSLLLRKRGLSVAKNLREADAVVVHTCSFIEAAKKESIQTILEAGKLKKPGKKLFVTGCMVQQHGQTMMDELPEVDAFLGTGQLTQIPDLLNNPKERFLDRRDPGGYTDPGEPRTGPENGTTAYLRLSEGCSHPCSFCVIPKLRGGLQSRTQDKIVTEARQLASQGVQELVLIGQDTGAWGTDIDGKGRLPELLEKLRGISGLRWIRLMYMHPASFSDDLIKIMSQSPDIFPYLDMPLQHIDEALLKDMNRIKGERALRCLLEKTHKHLPQLSLRTTFIVGYPGETDHQFQKLLAFIREGHFNYLGAFPYSQEESTPASRKPHQIDDDLKKERHDALLNAYYDVAHHKAQSRLGHNVDIVLDETEGNTILGRTAQEAPDIDAVIRLPQETGREGQIINAKLTSYEAFEYTAEDVRETFSV